jgi:sugar phosphate permease
VALGSLIAVQGLGGSLSGLAVGLIADPFGYSAAFLLMGFFAVIAGVVFFLFMPETRQTPLADPNGLPGGGSAALSGAGCG